MTETFFGFMLTTTPDGKVLVTYSRERPGFSVPEAVLLGVFDSIETAKDAISESVAS